MPVLDDAGKLEIPAAYSFAEGLKFLFSEASALAARHKSRGIAIRVADHSRFSLSDSDRNRLRIEGVVGAAFAVAGMNADFLVWSTLSSRLSLSKEVKKSTLADSSFRGLDWEQCSQEQRDAILAALTVLP